MPAFLRRWVHPSAGSPPGVWAYAMTVGDSLRAQGLLCKCRVYEDACGTPCSTPVRYFARKQDIVVSSFDCTIFV